MSVNKELISRIRSNVMALTDQIFHPVDVQHIKENDGWIERFVQVTKTEDAAQNMLVKALKWRKDYGVHELTEDYFPEEIYKIGLYNTDLKDKKGRPIMWVKINAFHKSDLTNLIKKFMVYNTEKINKQTSFQGYGAIFDITGVSLSDFDLDMLDFLKFKINVTDNYYPLGQKYTLVVNLPWILNAASNLVMSFIKDEHKKYIKFIKSEKLTDYLHPKQIPVYYKGLYDKNMAVIPKGVKPLEELTHTHYSAEQIKRIHSAFKKELK